MKAKAVQLLELAPPDEIGGKPLNELLRSRRSVRSFGGADLTVEQMGQILWAGQGRTTSAGYRTAPSAGATYPIEIHVVSRDGIFRYDSNRHAVERLAAEDRRTELRIASLDQRCVGDAPASFVIAAAVSRTARRYGDRAGRYAAMEAGSVFQNMCLEAVSLALGAVVVGAFDDDRVAKIAELPEGFAPLAIVSVGAPA